MENEQSCWGLVQIHKDFFGLREEHRKKVNNE
jgi:hypothetical protein